MYLELNDKNQITKNLVETMIHEINPNLTQFTIMILNKIRFKQTNKPMINKPMTNHIKEKNNDLYIYR